MKYDQYEKLQKLKELLDKGVLTDEEYQKEKEKLLNDKGVTQSSNHQATTGRPMNGMDENTYLMLLHLSQFAGYIVPVLGFVLPVILWNNEKDRNANVDRHGKNILNFIISYLFYMTILFILSFALIGLPFLWILGLLVPTFTIVAAVKASSGVYWKYPATIEFFKINIS